MLWKLKSVAIQQKKKAQNIYSASALPMNVSFFAGAQTTATDQNCRDQNVCSLPCSIADARCYTDASISPDDSSFTPRKAGLGIFILDPIGHSKFFIKAQINHVSCVLNAMASSSYKFLTIHRSFNTTAHLLAHQSFRAPELQCNLPNVSCYNVSHEHSCPLREELRLVTWEPFSLLQLLAANNKFVFRSKKN